jgi:hypothetical protein
MVAEQEIKHLLKDAPALRCQHLLDLIQDAKKHDDTIRTKTILEILKREEQKKQWRQINHSTRPPRGGNPTAIKVQMPTGTIKYNTEEEVFENAAAHLSKRFWLAYLAPVFLSEIMNDIGYLGDTQHARVILEGTYTYSPDTDQWTMKILKEAHMSYQQLSNKSIDTTVSIFDFQDYWQGANEAISSLYSRIHFGHYKAASFDKNLSALHAAKLSACAKKGIPLARWGVGLTILLEKTWGNNNIHKMRAIVLLEGDFNYYMKLIFAHRMMLLTQDKGQIPIECFAKKGSSCVNAVITKIMMLMNQELITTPPALVEMTLETIMTGLRTPQQVLPCKAGALLGSRFESFSWQCKPCASSSAPGLESPPNPMGDPTRTAPLD